MRHSLWTSCLLAALFVSRASATEPQSSWWGAQWGMARTYWSNSKNDEGFPRAGTAASILGIRRIQPWGNVELVPYAQLEWMHSTTSELVCDTCYGDLYTYRSQHREIDLGLNLHWFPSVGCGSVYFGGGPSLRLGHAAIRELSDRKPELSSDKTWIGLTLLGGWRTWQGENVSAFFEPQLTYSPANRKQGEYNPPTTLSLQMGVYWK